MPDIESHTDTVGGTKFITECDIQRAYWQIHIAKKDCQNTAFVTSKGKYVGKRNTLDGQTTRTEKLLVTIESYCYRHFTITQSRTVCMYV